MGFIMLAFFIAVFFIQYLKGLDSKAQPKQVPQQPQPPVRPVSSAQSRPERPVSTAYQTPVRQTASQSSYRDADRVYEKSSVEDDRYTAQGCGCCSVEKVGTNKSSAYYDEAQFYAEAQKIRSGKWT